MSSSARPRWALRLSMPTLLLLLALVVFNLTRLSLLIFMGWDEVPLALWPYVFAKGAWFDLAVLCYLAPWVLLYQALAPSAGTEESGQPHVSAALVVARSRRS